MNDNEIKNVHIKYLEEEIEYLILNEKQKFEKIEREIAFLKMEHEKRERILRKENKKKGTFLERRKANYNIDSLAFNKICLENHILNRKNIFTKLFSKNNTTNIHYAELIAKSDYFDGLWYLRKYELKNVNPITHYIDNERTFLYSPSEAFNPEAYYKKYSDLQSSNINLLCHYILFGKNEGRKL